MSTPPSVEYVLSRLGNTLICRKWGPTDYGQTFAQVELATSTDLGSTWNNAYFPLSVNASPAVATDSTGTQIAVANWQSSMYNSNAVDGLYLSAARSVRVYGDGLAELVHRGNGKWTLRSGANASGFFAPRPPQAD